MKLFDKQGQKNRTGALGELVVRKYLEDRGHNLRAVNYQKKYGEIDLITVKRRTVHFVEVKAVSYESKEKLDNAIARRSWRPEENVHRLKLQKVARTANVWLSENPEFGEWQIDVAAVRLVPSEQYASVKIIENVIIE